MEELIGKSVAFVGMILLFVTAIPYGLSLLHAERQSIAELSAHRQALQPVLERTESAAFDQPVISGAELHYMEAFGHWDSKKVYFNKKSASALPHHTFHLRWKRDGKGDISTVHVLAETEK
jgi:hypothetical protein